jgi:hypothetical protein
MKTLTFRKSMFVMLVCLTAAGCISPRQDVPTVWDKMGIPQSFVAVRDHFTNQSGERPWKERKPRVLRIADAANLISPNEAIKAAAEIKFEEDLAAQKIKALKYLGKIGCGCYDEDGKVEAAILAGLADCTPAVRLAAIEAIKEALLNCNLDIERDRRQDRKYIHQQKHEKKVAARKEKREDRIKRIQQRAAERRAHCGFCGGHGCTQCIECTTCMDMGCDTCIESCDPCGNDCGGCDECGGCPSCNACSCCTEKIQKKLADMAFGKQDNGCWKEPVAAVRAAAEAVLCLCPAPECDPTEVKPLIDPEKDPLINPELDKEKKEDDGIITMSFGNPADAANVFNTPITQPQRRSTPAPITTLDEFGQPQPTLTESRQVPPITGAGWNKTGVPVIESDVIEKDPNMISAKVSSINHQSKTISLTYDKEFMLPKGAKIVVRDLSGSDVEMIVGSSTPGTAEATLKSGSSSTMPTTNSVQIGVVSL